MSESIETIVNVSFSTAAATMGGTTVFNIVSAFMSNDKNLRESNTYSAFVNTVAFIHYVYMRHKRDSANIREITTIRYSDWFITTPLMLAELTSLWNTDVKSKWYGTAVASNMMMLLCGFYASTLRDNWPKNVPLPRRFYAAFALGFLMLLCIFTSMSAQYKCSTASEDEKASGMTFLSIWVLYGFAFLIRDEKKRSIAYNLLDIVAKGGLGIYVGSRSLEHNKRLIKN